MFATLAPGAAADGPVAGTTEVVAFDTSGGTPGDHVNADDITPDGRFLVMSSFAGDLVPTDTNDASDVFVVDRLFGTIERVSVSSAEAQTEIGRDSYTGSISDDGRYVAFRSESRFLVPEDTNFLDDVFVRDRAAGTTVRVSTSASGVAANNHALDSSISGDGSRIAFGSQATNLAGGSADWIDIFVKDRVGGAIERVSMSSLGVAANGHSRFPVLSRDGDIVSFQSAATSLVLNDLNEVTDVFVRDTDTDLTTRVSAPTGGEANGGSMRPSLSASGRYVAFHSMADNLVAGEVGDTFDDVFVRDRQSGMTTRVSVTTDGTKGNGNSRNPSISDDGDRVAFQTWAANLGAPASKSATVVRDRSAATSTRIPANPGGSDGTSDPEISGNGRYVHYDDVGAALGLGRTYLRILADTTFPDVGPNHPFFEHVSWLVDTGLTTGYADGTYKPGFTLTRQTTAAFLYRDAGEPAFVPPGTPTFTDVPTNHPFSKEIEWAADEGIVTGLPDGTFAPGTVVTRAAVAAFLSRAAGSPPFTPPGTPTFTDVATNHPFFTEIEWAAARGIVTGFADGTYRPGAAVTRQSMAAYLFRADWAGV
jgi:Tol biopolymer transport system component